MDQIMTAVSAQKSPFHARAAAATVADVMRLPLTTVTRYDHAAAAAYLSADFGEGRRAVANSAAGKYGRFRPGRPRRLTTKRGRCLAARPGRAAALGESGLRTVARRSSRPADRSRRHVSLAAFHAVIALPGPP